MTDKSSIITQTKHWINSFIIGHNICPFAKREFDSNHIHYEVVNEPSLENQLQSLMIACEQLDSDNTIETSLLIFPKGLSSFDNYLDFLTLANDLMHKQGYEGLYQLASFHPDYCFAEVDEGVDEDDASNYTNRSPYPMLHLIREDSLEKALQNYPNPENIPVRNIEYLRTLGNEKIQEILKKAKRR